MDEFVAGVGAAVVKRQSTVARSALRAPSQAASSRARMSRSGTRQSRHWPLSALNSLSAMLSH